MLSPLAVSKELRDDFESCGLTMVSPLIGWFNISVVHGLLEVDSVEMETVDRFSVAFGVSLRKVSFMLEDT